jgi:hypothetical protein
VIKNAKKRQPKFKVTEMTTQDFFNAFPLKRDVDNRKTFTGSKKV